MLIPKDAHLALNVTPSEATLSWAAPKTDKWLYAGLFWVLGPAFGLISLVPRDFEPRYDFSSLYVGLVMIAMGAVVFWLGSRTQTTILATPDRVADNRTPFTRWRSQEFHGKPLQFYVSTSSGYNSAGYSLSICMLDQDGIRQELAKYISPTMASQIWHELQEFYQLEDLDVLGEVAHQQYTESRRVWKDDVHHIEF